MFSKHACKYAQQTLSIIDHAVLKCWEHYRNELTSSPAKSKTVTQPSDWGTCACGRNIETWI